MCPVFVDYCKYIRCGNASARMPALSSMCGFDYAHAYLARRDLKLLFLFSCHCLTSPFNGFVGAPPCSFPVLFRAARRGGLYAIIIPHYVGAASLK